MNHMYTLGTHMEVVTDPEPLILVCNHLRHPKKLRFDRHRTKLLPFEYYVVFEPGKDTLCDYGSRQPSQIGTFTEDQKHQWATENNIDIFVNQIIQDQLPQAEPLIMLKTTTAKDPVMQQLKDDITKNKFCRNSLTKDKEIFDKRSYVDGVIMRGTQIIIPESLQG